MNRTRVLLVVSLLVVGLVFVTGTVGGDAHDITPNCESSSNGSTPPADFKETLEKDDLVMEILPKYGSTYVGNSTTFVICIVNPPENAESLSGILKIKHSIKMSECSPMIRAVVSESNRTMIVPIDRGDQSCSKDIPFRELQPGEGKQYSIILTNSSQVGEYKIEANLRWKDAVYGIQLVPRSHTKTATLQIEEPPCSLVCEIEKVWRFVVEILRKYPWIALLGLLLTLLGPKNVRGYLYKKLTRVNDGIRDRMLGDSNRQSGKSESSRQKGESE